MEKDKKNKLDYVKINNALSLGNIILRVFLVFMVLALGLLFIYLAKELKIFTIIKDVLVVASPLFIGILIAWLLDPAVTWLTKKKVKRSLATMFVFVIFFALIYLFFYLLIPLLYTQVNELVKILPDFFLTVSNFIHELFNKLSKTGINFTAIEENVYETIGNISSDLASGLPNMIMGIVTTVVSSIGTFIFGVMIAFYLLLDFDAVKHALYLVPKKYHLSIETITTKLNNAFRDFVQGTLFISFIIAIISWVGYGIVGLPSPLLFGIVCGITNIIPYIGPWIGGAICVVVGFTISPWVGALSAIIAFIVQQIDGMVLQPLIMGKTMKLHPVTIMIGLLVFGYFWGVWGMILATPVMAGIKIIINFIDEKYEVMDKIKQD